MSDSDLPEFLDTPDPRAWHAIDRSNRPHEYGAYLQRVAAAPAVDRMNASAASLLEVADGMRVLDIGCGVGASTAYIARHVSRGLVAGVDSSLSILGSSVQPEGATLLAAAGDTLPFCEGAFNCVQVARVLMHLSEPELVVSEGVRVLRRGGRILLNDPDSRALVIGGVNGSLVEAVLPIRQSYVKSPFAGSMHRSWLKHTGIGEIDSVPTIRVATSVADLEPHTQLIRSAFLAEDDGLLPAGSGRTLLAELLEAEREGTLTATLISFQTIGHKAS